MCYKAAASRTVWLSALDRVCDQHGIFKPTYPTDKMTLSELEHAASGPHRFVNDYGSAPKSHTEAYMKRWIPCRMRTPDSDTSDGLYKISNLYLIPGGRFLLTAGKPADPSSLGSLCLWDLGYNTHSPAKAFPVATAPIDNPTVTLTACPSLQGSYLDVMILTR